MSTLFEIANLHRTTGAARPAPAPTVELPSVRGIVELLERAKANGLKYPKLWLRLPDDAPLRITIAGEKSRTPGYLMLTDGEAFGQNVFYGRISPAGALELRDVRSTINPNRGRELVELLTRLAADPAKVASEYGHMTGNCCFCERKLADERSTAVGYGRICADKFGLPWGR